MGASGAMLAEAKSESRAVDARPQMIGAQVTDWIEIERNAPDALGRRPAGALRGAVTKCRGPLRRFVGVAADAELLQPAAQGIRMEVEDLRRAAGAVDDPRRLPQDREDVVPLQSF